MRKKLQNNKDYVESPKFLPALIFRRSPSLQFDSLLDYIFLCTQIYISYYGNSHVIKVIISLQNFLGISYHPCVTFSLFLMV